MLGIDVHGAKGPIDWREVKSAGVEFAFVKASEGSSFSDSRTALNVEGCNANGIKVGCYHFARPDLRNPPTREAEHFLRRIEPLSYTLPPVLDIERGTGSLGEWAVDFLEIVERESGHVPILYTYLSFAGHLIDQRLARYPLWLAAYRTTPPRTPAPWAAWTIWQYTSSGSVPGVPGRCDMNRADTLPALAGASLPPLPASITTDVPEDDMRRIDLAIDTDDQGRGYRDIAVPPLSVISVVCNTANPPSSGYKPIPDVARLDVAGQTRVVVEEAVPNGRIDVSVWAA